MSALNNEPADLWTKDFILTSLSNLFLFFSFHMLTPTLPVFVVASNGNEFEAGLVVGVFTITALLIRPFAGRALDNLDRKKILFFGLLIFAASTIGYQWMPSVALILLIRAIQGIGWGISSTTYGTLITDLIPQKRRAEGIGYFGLSSHLGMAFAPLCGIWVMDQYGFTTLFLLAALPIAVGILIMQFIQCPRVQTQKVSVSKENLFEKNALYPSLLVMFFIFSHGGILSSLTLFGQEAGIENVGWFFLMTAFILMIIRPISGKIYDRKGHVYLLIPGAVVSVLGLLVLSYSTNILMLIVAALFYGLGFGLIHPTLQAWAIDMVSPQRRGAATGTFFFAFDFGIGAGAMLLGFMAKWTGYAAIYRVSILFMVLFGLVYGFYLVRERKRVATEQYLSS